MEQFFMNVEGNTLRIFLFLSFESQIETETVVCDHNLENVWGIFNFGTIKIYYRIVKKFTIQNSLFCSEKFIEKSLLNIY